MTPRQAARACLVWLEAGGQRRPGILVHREGRDWWVSFTDKPGGQARCRPADLTARQLNDGGRP
jgi:hypothetical protein